MREKPDRAANNEVKAVMAQTIKLDDARELDFDREMVEQAYDRWAPIYDLVFGGVFSKGRDAAIQATNKIGGRVLEVGVGTGISLPLYAPHHRADAAAAGAPAWFPHRRVRLVALHAVAFGCLEDGVGGAPPDSAARSLLPGSLPEGRRGLTRQKFRSRVVILGCVTLH